MTIDRPPFRALCEAIFRFQRECQSADMKASLTINLDPETFARVMRSEEAVLGAAHMKNGNLRIMDAIVIPRRLSAGPNDE